MVCTARVSHILWSRLWSLSDLGNKMTGSLISHDSRYSKTPLSSIPKTFNDTFNSLKQQRLKFKIPNNRSPEYKFFDKYISRLKGTYSRCVPYTFPVERLRSFFKDKKEFWDGINLFVKGIYSQKSNW